MFLSFCVLDDFFRLGILGPPGNHASRLIREKKKGGIQIEKVPGKAAIHQVKILYAKKDIIETVNVVVLDAAKHAEQLRIAGCIQRLKVSGHTSQLSITMRSTLSGKKWKI